MALATQLCTFGFLRALDGVGGGGQKSGFEDSNKFYQLEQHAVVANDDGEVPFVRFIAIQTSVSSVCRFCSGDVVSFELRFACRRPSDHSGQHPCETGPSEADT